MWFISTPLFSFFYFNISSSLWKCSHVCAEGEPLICDAANWICLRSREPVVRSAASAGASEAIAIMQSRASSSQEKKHQASICEIILRIDSQTWDFFSPLWAPWDARCTLSHSRHKNGKNESDRYHSSCHENFHRKKILYSTTLSLGLALGADYDTPQLQSFFCQFS
jgi:hypothetical protein